MNKNSKLKNHDRFHPLHQQTYWKREKKKKKEANFMEKFKLTLKGSRQYHQQRKKRAALPENRIQVYQKKERKDHKRERRKWIKRWISEFVEWLGRSPHQWIMNPPEIRKSHDNYEALDYYSGSWRFGLRTAENRAIRRRFGRIIPSPLQVFS